MQVFWANAVVEAFAALPRYARIGSIVMLLHDPSDIFLEAAKLASYAGAEAPSTLLFTALLLTWCSLRLGLLPFWVIRSALCGPQPCSVTHGVPGQTYRVDGVVFPKWACCPSGSSAARRARPSRAQ